MKKHNSGERNVFVVVRGRFYLLKETHTHLEIPGKNPIQSSRIKSLSGFFVLLLF